MRRSAADTPPQNSTANINLAVALRLLGMPEEAHRLHEAALTDLAKQLGKSHPLTLACAINLANDLAALGQHDQAKQLGGATLEPRAAATQGRTSWDDQEQVIRRLMGQA
ncbi:tetratricopeptide repeat protein [Streptomyces sp. NPDC059340]|uniref:tetratricopeptide repeat protein n=1 Tax=Streptomyces sp. NPDC059340 TaxID=3346806 RepID=UPI0036B2C41F